jgi:hypothetical protein
MVRRARPLGPGPRLAAIVGLVALLSRADVARAEGGDRAAADALFDDGKQLVEAGRVAEACARFEASMAVAPRLGSQLNLADCYERLGKTASAWLAFGEAAALARRLADRRWTYARTRQAALKHRLSRLVIAIGPGIAPAELAVTRDGARVPPEAYGVEVPVDPGEHVIEATAPARQPWSIRITVSRPGEVATVAIPELAPAPAPPPPPPAPPISAPVPPPSPVPVAPAGDRPGRRLTPAAWIAAGIGVAGLGAGAYFGLSAAAEWRQASPGCDQTYRCIPEAFAAGERAHRDRALSTAGFAVAGAALVTGVVLYLQSPRDSRGAMRIAPVIAPGAAGMTIAGAW